MKERIVKFLDEHKLTEREIHLAAIAITASATAIICWLGWNDACKCLDGTLVEWAKVADECTRLSIENAALKAAKGIVA